MWIWWKKNQSEPMQVFWGVYESLSKFVEILVRFISYENRWCDHNFFLHKILLIILNKASWLNGKILVRKYIFYWIKTPFFGIFARPTEKIELSTRIIKKTVIFSGILTGCIDKSIIKVNVGGFNMWFFITFFYFFCQKTSVPRVYVKTITLHKLQK